MNFFGHAAVATWRSLDSSFVLGAMLPDFATMIRTRPPASHNETIGAGVRFHHQTDEVFHDAPSFRLLCAEAFSALEASGLARGSARAVAHVGIEILLDGTLARDAVACSAYLDALALYPALASDVEFHSAAAHGNCRQLVAALAARGISEEHSSPEAVAFRVSRALGSRPRLALADGDLARVSDWAARARHEVRRVAPTLVAELRAGLGLADLSVRRGNIEVRSGSLDAKREGDKDRQR
jgi:hypothetical protein